MMPSFSLVTFLLRSLRRSLSMPSSLMYSNRNSAMYMVILVWHSRQRSVHVLATSMRWNADGKVVEQVEHVGTKEQAANKSNGVQPCKSKNPALLLDACIISFRNAAASVWLHLLQLTPTGLDSRPYGAEAMFIRSL